MSRLATIYIILSFCLAYLSSLSFSRDAICDDGAIAIDSCPGAARTIYVSSSNGSDESGDGSVDNPLQTIGRAMEYNYNSSETLRVLLMGNYYPAEGNTELDYHGSVKILSYPFTGKTVQVGKGDGNVEYFIRSTSSSSLLASCFILCGVSPQPTLLTTVVAEGYKTTVVSDSVFSNSGILNPSDGYGGALHLTSDAYEAHLTLSHIHCSENMAGYGGCAAIILSHYSTATVFNVYMANNYAFHSGGAMYLDAPFSLDLSNFTCNKAAQLGGAIYWNASSVNSDEHLSTLSITHVHFEENEAEEGGAMAIHRGHLKTSGCYFITNAATSVGGAIFIKGAMSRQDYSYEYSYMENNTGLNAAGGIYLVTTAPSDVNAFSFVDNDCDNHGYGTQLQVRSVSGDVNFTESTLSVSREDASNNELYIDRGTYLRMITNIVMPPISARVSSEAVLDMTMVVSDASSTLSLFSLYQEEGGSVVSSRSLDLFRWEWYGGLMEASQSNPSALVFVDSLIFRSSSSNVGNGPSEYHNISNFDLMLAGREGRKEIYDGVRLVLGEKSLTIEGQDVELSITGSVQIDCQIFRNSGQLLISGSLTLSGGSDPSISHTTLLQVSSHTVLFLSDPLAPPILNILGSACFRGNIYVMLGIEDIESATFIVLAAFETLSSPDSCNHPKCYLFGSDGSPIKEAEFYFTETELVVVPYPISSLTTTWLLMGIGAAAVLIFAVIIIVICMDRKKGKGNGYDEDFLIDPIERNLGERAYGSVDGSCSQGTGEHVGRTPGSSHVN